MLLRVASALALAIALSAISLVNLGIQLTRDDDD